MVAQTIFAGQLLSLALKVVLLGSLAEFLDVHVDVGVFFVIRDLLALLSLIVQEAKQLVNFLALDLARVIGNDRGIQMVVFLVTAEQHRVPSPSSV